MKRILIISAGTSAGIAFTRCLRASPEHFYLIGNDCNELSVHLAETDTIILAPPADQPNYIEILNEIINRFGIELVYAQSDIEIQTISENRNKIAANVFLPDENTVEICSDKFKSNQVWERKGIPVARTQLIKNRNDLKRALETIGSPLWLRSVKGWAGKGSLLVKKYKHAEMWIDYFDAWGNFVASEYLPNANFGWDAVFKDGELICSHTKQRLKYVLPGASPSGVTGTTGVAKSVDRKDVVEIAKNAVYAIDPKPEGVFSVDLKEDKSGIPHVTEINAGRFLSSSLHFFYKAKYLLPYVYVKAAFHENVEPITQNNFGEILVRTLDKEPLLLNENKVKTLLIRRDNWGYLIIDNHEGCSILRSKQD